MPLLYGEGEKAFLRLQAEIMKISSDESILVWGSFADHKIFLGSLFPYSWLGGDEIHPNCCNAGLADSLSQFENWSQRYTPFSTAGRSQLMMTDRGLQVSLPLFWVECSTQQQENLEQTQNNSNINSARFAVGLLPYSCQSEESFLGMILTQKKAGDVFQRLIYNDVSVAAIPAHLISNAVERTICIERSWNRINWLSGPKVLYPSSHRIILNSSALDPLGFEIIKVVAGASFQWAKEPVGLKRLGTITSGELSWNPVCRALSLHEGFCNPIVFIFFSFTTRQLFGICVDELVKGDKFIARIRDARKVYGRMLNIYDWVQKRGLESFDSYDESNQAIRCRQEAKNIKDPLIVISPCLREIFSQQMYFINIQLSSQVDQ
jgi:hypothetical protein